jgi:mannitol-1-phosphate/altronate dehydrogenase
VPESIRVGDTVMGRMCQWIESPGPGWTRLDEDVDIAVVGEPFFGMPVEAHMTDGMAAVPEAFEVCSVARFAALEDLKMFAHNGLHAFLASLGALRGRELFCELSGDGDIMALARALLIEEVGPALLSKHRGALGRNEYGNYATTILRRITCPGLRDSIGRGVRGALRKLAPWERFVSGIRCVAEQGGEPAIYCRGVAAAVRMARSLGETSDALPEVLTRVCELDARSDRALFEMVLEGDRWLDREFPRGA